MSNQYLSKEEKQRELNAWRENKNADIGVRPLMDRLNLLPGVCTVQSCVGHKQLINNTAYRVANGCVEMRLDKKRTKLFYDNMETLRGTNGVDDISIHWRTPYQLCTVRFVPGKISLIVNMLEKILTSH